MEGMSLTGSFSFAVGDKLVERLIVAFWRLSWARASSWAFCAR